MAMQFSVGDKVVHPLHGAGLVTGIEFQGDGPDCKSYYVIAIQGQGGTLHIPVLGAGESGLRAAMSPARRTRMLSILRGRPRALPADHKLRESQIRAGLRRGGVLDLAGIVRDLTLHGVRSRLTQKDSDYLRKARERLASEIALVSGISLADADRLVHASMAAAAA